MLGQLKLRRQEFLPQWQFPLIETTIFDALANFQSFKHRLSASL
jgi:hypothetical protein